MNRMLPLITLALATPAAVAVAAEETRASAAAKFHAEFVASDANRDGSLSRTEVEARIGRMSAGRGSIDPVHAKRLAGLWFDAADRNKDGKVTETEAQSLLASTFKRYDANGDGRIEPDERAAAKQALGGR